MKQRREGIRLGPRGLGRIAVRGAMDPKHLFRRRIPRLEERIREGPRWRDAFEMVDLSEIPLAEAGQHRAEKFGVAADVVEDTGREALVGMPVDPGFRIVIATRAEDLGGIPVRFFAWDP